MSVKQQEYIKTYYQFSMLENIPNFEAPDITLSVDVWGILISIHLQNFVWFTDLSLFILLNKGLTLVATYLAGRP